VLVGRLHQCRAQAVEDILEQLRLVRGRDWGQGQGSGEGRGECEGQGQWSVVSGEG
jgi:hypothetical protein